LRKVLTAFITIFCAIRETFELRRGLRMGFHQVPEDDVRWGS